MLHKSITPTGGEFDQRVAATAEGEFESLVSGGQNRATVGDRAVRLRLESQRRRTAAEYLVA